MFSKIALWIAQQLLKFVGRRLFHGRLQAVFNEFDLITVTDERALSPEGVLRSMSRAVQAVEGTRPTPLQYQALRLLHDPVKAAEGFISTSR